VKMPVEQIDRIKGLAYRVGGSLSLCRSRPFRLTSLFANSALSRMQARGSVLSIARRLFRVNTLRCVTTRRRPVFHLFSRTVYVGWKRTICATAGGHSFEFTRTRLLLLDFILANQIWLISRPSKIRSDSFAKQWVCPGTAYRPRFTRVVPVVSQPFVISSTNSPSFLLRLSQGLLLWSLSAMWIRDFKHRLRSLVIWPRIRGSSPIGGFPLLVHRGKGCLFSKWLNSVFVHS